MCRAAALVVAVDTTRVHRVTPSTVVVAAGVIRRPRDKLAARRYSAVALAVLAASTSTWAPGKCREKAAGPGTSRRAAARAMRESTPPIRRVRLRPQAAADRLHPTPFARAEEEVEAEPPRIPAVPVAVRMGPTAVPVALRVVEVEAEVPVEVEPRGVLRSATLAPVETVAMVRSTCTSGDAPADLQAQYRRMYMRIKNRRNQMLKRATENTSRP